MAHESVKIKNRKDQNWELRDFEKIEFFSLFLMIKRLSSGQKWFLRPYVPLTRGMFGVSESEEKAILISEDDLFLTLGLGTSSARNENLIPLLNKNTPLFT